MITVEVNIGKGRKFYLVGLPDNAVKESQQRMIAALGNIGYRFPGQRIVINMAPADIKKEGPAFDLPIAVGMALGAKLAKKAWRTYVVLGDGECNEGSIWEASMSAAVANTNLAGEYKLDTSLVAATILVSTLLSPLTVTPLIAYLQR